jgi:hypothetical protein
MTASPKLLGREPTRRMMTEGAKALGWTRDAGHDDARDCFRSMWDAAPPSPDARAEALEEAAREVEAWWLSEGMHAFSGAPYAIFALRAALKSEAR